MKKWLDLVKMIAPALLAASPIGRKHPDLVPVITEGIVRAETIYGAKGGAEKLKEVLGSVDTAVKGINAVQHDKIPDPMAVEQQATQAVNAVVATVNLFRDMDGDGDYDADDKAIQAAQDAAPPTATPEG